MHVVEKTTVVLTSVHRVHRVLKFTMDFVPCKLHGDDRGDNMGRQLSALAGQLATKNCHAHCLN